MRTTMILGLREGIEGAVIIVLLLVVLRDQRTPTTLRRLRRALALTIAGCGALALLLHVADLRLSATALVVSEGALALVAAGTLTSTAIWALRHSRRPRSAERPVTADRAREGDGAWPDDPKAIALLSLAVLAVAREGVEVSTFLAVIDPAVGTVDALGGLAAGLGISVIVGVVVHRLASRTDTDRFVTVASGALVVVAAGLVSLAFRAAHDSGWLVLGNDRLVDLSGVVHPDSTAAHVFTGIVGLSVTPTMAEAIGWGCYLIAVGFGMVAAWHRSRPTGDRSTRMGGVR